jgi:hypothetical protein
MIELAIFNEWMAEELVARGFNLVGRSRLAWFFEDSVLLERTVAELVESLVDNE